MLRYAKQQRTLKQNLGLASSTAFAAGIINVAGLVSFFAFTSSISGHMANLAKNLVTQNFYEITLFAIWMLLFFLGAFISSFTVKSFAKKNQYKAHAVPIILEMIILLAVAIYGHNFYKETRLEREIVISLTIFAMGLQTGLVSIVSGGLIKSTSLASLFTDLGSEVAEYYYLGTKKDREIRNRIYVRLTVLAFYFIGGLVGGFFFNKYEFGVFYLVPVILLFVLL
jgi:uncharacterized membrane protein YoaK (UPF0700 family)